MLPMLFGEMRVAGDPQLRFTPSGQAVANFRLVASKRKKVEGANGEPDTWVDDKECWLNGTLWGRAAENAVESLSSGDLVEVRGVVETRNYETKEGEKRVSFDVNLYSISPSLAYATAKVSKVERSSGSGGGAGGAQSGSAAPADDPWATPAQEDLPPF